MYIERETRKPATRREGLGFTGRCLVGRPRTSSSCNLCLSSAARRLQRKA